MASKEEHYLDSATREVDQERLTRVLERAKEVFGNEDYANAWLTTPNLALHSVKPMAFLSDEAGEILVLKILASIESGGVV